MFFALGIERLPAIGRLALLMFAVAAGSIALTLVCVGWVLQRDLDTITREVVSDELAEYSAFYNRHGLDSIRVLFDHAGHAVGHATAVTSPDGQILFRSPRDWPQLQDWRQLREGQDVAAIRVARLPDGERYLWAGVRLNDANVLWYGKTDSQERLFGRHIFDQLLIAGLLVGALSLVPILWFSREIARPLRAFTLQANKIAAGGSGERLHAPRAVPELRDFAESFNAGLQRIEQLTGSLQFANDQLAHELRTPLARLRARLENAEVPPPAGAIEEIDRIKRLLQTILDIRAGEDGLLYLQREDTDLASHVSSLVDLYRPSAEDQSVTLTFQADPGCALACDRQRISQAFCNLLDNALRFTPPGGTISVAVRKPGATVSIEVSDSGPGLPAGFEIAGRGAGRARREGGNHGIGLGLRLALVVAESHGGNLTCSESGRPGASFTIRLPAGEVSNAVR
jgi:signal transduction histidine kinase